MLKIGILKSKYLIIYAFFAIAIVLATGTFLLNKRSLVKQKQAEQRQAEVKKETEGKDLAELMAEGKKLFEQNNAKKAAVFFEKAAGLDKNYRDSWVMAGYANLASQNPKQARIYLRRAVNLDPAFGLTHELLARLYDQLNYPDLAEQERAKAQDLGLRP